MKRFLVIFLTLLLTACNSPSKSDEENIEKATIELNQKHFDKAIAILKLLPQSYKVKDLLASAYAGKGGFNALSLYETVEKNNLNLQNIYLLSPFYNIENIHNLDIALSYIHPQIPDPSQVPLSSNVKYASIQVCKASQILLKNYFSRPMNLNDTCENVRELYKDIRTITVAMNKAALSLSIAEPEIYEDILRVQNELGISPNFYGESVISDDDVMNAKNELGKFYKEYINKVPDSCNE